MDFLYKTTTRGRAVIAACMHLEQPVKITRVAFGRGTVPEGTELADVHELLDYVSDGTIASRSHADDRFVLTIRYANNEHPDVKMFYLSEFMVYTEDPETGEEADLLYGTMGDYRQPVPAYSSAYPHSEFNFPLTIIISNELNVSVSAPAGLFTYDDFASLAGAGALGVTRQDIKIPTDGWVETDDGGEYTLALNLAMPEVTARMTPLLTVLPDSRQTAAKCGLAEFAQTQAGILRLWTTTAPTGPIKASLVLLGDVSGLQLTTNGGATTLSAATADTLGGVMVKDGSGLTIDRQGNLAIDTASEAEVNEMLAEVFTSSDSK